MCPKNLSAGGGKGVWGSICSTCPNKIDILTNPLDISRTNLEEEYGHSSPLAGLTVSVFSAAQAPDFSIRSQQLPPPPPNQKVAL